jgi:hypothetical protein
LRARESFNNSTAFSNVSGTLDSISIVAN